jgi:hypothetical protein
MSFYGVWDDHDIAIMVIITIKQRIFKCIKCTNKRDELYDVPTYSKKFLKYDPFWHQIENICHVLLKNNLIRVKLQVHLIPWIFF